MLTRAAGFGYTWCGKSSSARALQRVVVHKKNAAGKIDGVSLLMTAESSEFPTAYGHLIHELEQRLLPLRSLADVEIDRRTLSYVGDVLWRLGHLFQLVNG